VGDREKIRVGGGRRIGAPEHPARQFDDRARVSFGVQLPPVNTLGQRVRPS
jgi:hypothetical protein